MNTKGPLMLHIKAKPQGILMTTETMVFVHNMIFMIHGVLTVKTRPLCEREEEKYLVFLIGDIKLFLIKC